MRPDRLVVVTGTGTEVGKTFVAAAVAAELRGRGLGVAARKPLQSYLPGERTDAAVLGAATGEDPEVVCPPAGSLAVPMAPPMAAAELGVTLPTTAELAARISASWPDPVAAVGLVEGAGGLLSPLSADGHTGDLVGALDPDVVLVVTGAALGVINLVRLTRGALFVRRVIVHLNRFDPADPLQRANADWLTQVDGTEVTTDVGDLADRLSP